MTTTEIISNISDAVAVGGNTLTYLLAEKESLETYAELGTLVLLSPVTWVYDSATGVSQFNFRLRFLKQSSLDMDSVGLLAVVSEMEIAANAVIEEIAHICGFPSFQIRPIVNIDALIATGVEVTFTARLRDGQDC